MNGFRTSHRSRRRRASFALFGRRVAGAGRAEPVTVRARRDQEPLLEVAFSEETDASIAAADDDWQQSDVQAVVFRLQREASRDQRLLARIPSADLDHLIEQTVSALWAESRVTTFVPLLAMRRIYEELGIADGTSATGELARQDA